MARRILKTSGGLALGSASGSYLKKDPTFDAQSTALEWTVGTDDILESVNRRLVDPAAGNRVYSVTIGATEHVVDWDEGSVDIAVSYGSCDYTLNIGQWGYCTLTYNAAHVANLPAVDTTSTITTIASYRLCDATTANIISSSYGSVAIKVNGASGGTAPGDTTPPTIAAISQSGFNVTLDLDTTVTLSENVVAGTGNFYKYDETNGAVFETKAIGSCTVLNNTVTIPWSTAEANATSYSVYCDAGVVQDVAGNAIAAVAHGTFVYTTASSGGGTIVATVDATVSSLSALYSQLASWESNWAGTVPPGKTSTDSRVVGLDASTSGAMTLSNYTFPYPVYVRHVGTFSATGSEPVAECSVAHTGTGTLAGSTNLYLYLMDLRYSTTLNSAMWQTTGATDCGIIRCVGKGAPFTVDTTAHGSTAWLVEIAGTTRFTFKHNALYYFNYGPLVMSGTNTQLEINGYVANYSGSDDMIVRQNNKLVDPLITHVHFTRRRMKQPGKHCDAFQFNSSTSGAPICTRFTGTYNVMLRGKWGGDALVNTSESGWGGFFMDTVQSNQGPHLYENNIGITGHGRTFVGFIGGGNTAYKNIAVQHDNDQPPVAAYPDITNQQTYDYNIITAKNSTATTLEGPNGVRLVVNGASNGSGADLSGLLTYMTTIPTNYTDLWDIRPPTGSPAHPDYVGTKVGPWELWQKLFNGDADTVLSKVGWPIAPLWVDHFDRNANFWGGYTGTFDANGDNA